MLCIQVQATAAGTAHAIIIWWQLNLDASGLNTLDTTPCWVANPAPETALQEPHATPQHVSAPDAAPLHGSSTAREPQLTTRISESRDAAPSWHDAHAASSGLSSCRQDPLAGAAHVALAVSSADSAVPEDCPSLEQGRRPQQQQQWRDHWKQCWTPVQPHFELGKQQAISQFLLGPPNIHLVT